MSKANGSEALVAEQLSKDRAVIELCRRSLVNHFVVRDMDAALAYMADDVEWLGPFSCQTASDKKTMEDILRPEYSIRLALADERWRARKRANTWIVSARYTLLVVSAGGERSMPFKQHATYVWAPTPDGPRIVHLHVSNATDANPLLPSLDPGQNAIEFLYEHFDAQGSGAGKLSFRDTDGDVHVLHPNVHAASSGMRTESSRCEAPWQAWKRNCLQRTSFACTAVVWCIAGASPASRIIRRCSTTAPPTPSRSDAAGRSSNRSN